MDVLHPRCAGLDVHKKTVVAAVRLVEHGKVEVEVRTFETTTAGLIALAEWLSGHGVTAVAMEATGVYWKPVWHILSTEGSFELVLANAQHVKAVPGRKRDVSDAVWLAELQAHGLIRGSFVPPPEVAELRSLMRTRKQLVRERTSHIQRIQKTLEEANIKLDSVISDVLGQSGRAMLEAMIAGESDPKRLAALASPRIKASPETLMRALDGRLTEVHREHPVAAAEGGRERERGAADHVVRGRRGNAGSRRQRRGDDRGEPAEDRERQVVRQRDAREANARRKEIGGDGDDGAGADRAYDAGSGEQREQAHALLLGRAEERPGQHDQQRRAGQRERLARDAVGSPGDRQQAERHDDQGHVHGFDRAHIRVAHRRRQERRHREQ